MISNISVPAPFLVGIETNPGPKTKSITIVEKKKNKNKNKNKNKSVTVVKESFLGKAGGFLGGLMGPTGATIGKAAGNFISKITGFGDYKVNNNTLLTSGAPPSFVNNGGGFIVSHREFIADIVGSETFSLTSYSINPGLASSFPWLAAVARNFEEYSLLGQIYEYRPSSGSAVSSTSSALGTVIMATNYDVADPLFTTKQQMESYEYSTSSVPFAPMMHPIECDPKQTVLPHRYVRYGAVPSGYDGRLYDVGNFQIATSGMQSSYVVGELWVTYHVAFYKPRISLPLGATTLQAHFTESPAGSASATNRFGTSGGYTKSGNTIDLTFPDTNSFVVNKIGTYLLTYGFTSPSVSITASPSVTYGSNISTKNLFIDQSTNNMNSFYTNYATGFIILDVLTVGSGSENTVTFSGVTSMASGTADVCLVQISSGLSTILGTTIFDRIDQLELLVKQMKLNSSYVMLNIGDEKKG